MNQPLVSIITTFYNSGDFVHSAMNSLLNQSYKNIEFICVNDGSDDDTKKKLEEYASLDKRIKLFNKTNESSPHNAIGFGQEKVLGKYVMTFDHDDQLSEDAIESGVNAMLNNPTWDASLFRVFRKKDNGIKIDIKKRPSKVLTGEEIIISCLRGFEYSLRPFLKTEYFLSELYKFPKSWTNYDEYIGIKILGNCKLIGLNNGIYYYQDNPLSITKNIKFKHIEHLEVHFLLMKKYINEVGLYDDIKFWYEVLLFKKLNNLIKYYNKNIKQNIKLSHAEKEYADSLFRRCFNELNKNLIINSQTGLKKCYLRFIFTNYNIYIISRKFR